MLAREAGRCAFDSLGDMGIGDDGGANQENTEGKLGKEVREMNYKQAVAVKHLAPGNYEVLKGLEWECPECLAGLPGFEPQRCNTCKGKGIIHYSWTPRVGEWVLWGGIPHNISCIKDDMLITTSWVGSFNENGEDTGGAVMSTNMPRSEVTPILEWEVIEGILVRAGYQLATGLYNKDTLDKKISASIQVYGTVNELVKTYAKSRLPAVYEAVLALGKERGLCD